MKVEFYKHNVSEEDIKNVVEVLRKPFLSTGKEVEEFEKRFSEYLNCRYAVGVTSGTAALHLSLLALDIGTGDEVITTPMTFMATSNAIIYVGATPIFLDVEPKTGNINPDLIEAKITPETKAILPVHLYGEMCNMGRIREIADKHNLVVIEDAAHAIEAKQENSRLGHLSNTACFSFYPTKSITCGEGGLIVTNDTEVASKLKKMRLHGMSKSAWQRYEKQYQHWDMELLGFKYNMSNIQAALLLNQLEHIEEYKQRRKEICQRYEEAFKDDPNIRLLEASSGSARLMFTILVPSDKRDPILSELQEEGIGVAVNYRAIHLLSYYKGRYDYHRGMFPVAEDIGDSTITLPLYPKLTDEEVEYVIKKVKKAVEGKSGLLPQ